MTSLSSTTQAKNDPKPLILFKKSHIVGGLQIVWLEYCLDAQQNHSFQIVNYETASRNGEPFAQLIDKKGGFLPSTIRRYCTQYLKIDITTKYLKSLGLKEADLTRVLGIRYDEPNRYFKNKDKAFMPLYEAKIDAAQVRHFWKQQAFDLQLKDYEGNCDLCFQKGKTKLLTILAEHPEYADWWIEQETKNKSKTDFAMGSFSIVQLLQQSKGKFNKTLDFWEKPQQGVLMLEDEAPMSCFCGD